MAQEEKEYEIVSMFFAAALVFGLWLLFFDTISWSVFWILLLSSTVLGGLLEYLVADVNRNKKELELRQRLEAERQQIEQDLEPTRRKIEAHMDTLARKKRTLVRAGDYGETIDHAWRKEVKRFLTIALEPAIYFRLGGDDQSAGSRLETLVDEMVSDHIEIVGSSFSDLNVSNMDGVEYEAFCGEILEGEGWKVQRTPPTGDHGVDLIAAKPDRRVAIQCKKYSSPVGNKAVQEAYSGMKFFDAEEAVVVTNSTFTQAAQVLANKLSVALKHHDELKGL